MYCNYIIKLCNVIIDSIPRLSLITFSVFTGGGRRWWYYSTRDRACSSGRYGGKFARKGQVYRACSVPQGHGIAGQRQGAAGRERKSFIYLRPIRSFLSFIGSRLLETRESRKIVGVKSFEFLCSLSAFLPRPL